MRMSAAKIAAALLSANVIPLPSLQPLKSHYPQPLFAVTSYPYRNRTDLHAKLLRNSFNAHAMFNNQSNCLIFNVCREEIFTHNQRWSL